MRKILAIVLLLWPLAALAQMTLTGAGGTKGGGVCSQATTFLARTSGLSPTETLAYQNLICGMVADGTWPLMDAVYVFATNTTTTANLNLVSASYGLTQHGSCTFTADVGYQCDGSTGYFDTGFNPFAAGGNYSANSASGGAYVLTNRTASNLATEIGYTNNSNVYLQVIPFYTGLFYFDVNDNTFPNVASVSSRGAWIASRTGASVLNGYLNGSSTPVGSSGGASNGLANYNVFISALNQTGTATQFSPDQLGAAFIGAGLTGAQAAAVNNRLNNFMSAFGQNVYTPAVYGPATVTQASANGAVLTWMSVNNPGSAPGGPTASGNGFTCWGYGCTLQAIVNFQSPLQNYTFTAAACIFQAPALPTSGLVLWAVDSGAVGRGSTGAFTQQVTNVDTGSPCGTTVNYTWSMPVTSGIHLVQLVLYTDTNIYTSVINASVTAAGGSVPLEPAGSRDASQFPFSSYSLWNTAIGSTASWSLSTDGDTVTLNGLAGAINAGNFSTPVYAGTYLNPVLTFGASPQVWLPTPATSAHMPPGMTPDPSIDANINVNDITQLRYAFNGMNGCSVSGGGIACTGSNEVMDNCNVALDYGFSQQIYAGLIRAADISAGSIKHMLAAGFSFNATKAVATVWSGQWPNFGTDFCGPTGCYTGGTNGLLYGSTFGLPSTYNCATAGLTAGGLMLCHALQDYGAIEMVSAGTSQVTLYAEGSLSGNTTLGNMASDFNTKLVPQLRVLRNQGPTTPNGGGTPRQAALPGLLSCQAVR